VLAKFRARLTYANLMATVAVFIALGGSSYAAITVTGKNVKNSSLTGKDIKNNSLTGSDIKNLKSGDVSDHSLLAKDFKAGQLPVGPQGLKGDKGASGATHVVVRSLQTIGESANITIACHPGERAIGGGAGRSNGTFNSTDTVRTSWPAVNETPAPAGATPNGWDTGFDTGGSANVDMTFYAVCASP
jgi:hypothetical protein